MMGPLLFTQIFAAAIRGGSLPNLPGVPYLLSGALLAGGLLLSWRVTRPPSQS
jgi:hypothetical protein